MKNTNFLCIILVLIDVSVAITAHQKSVLSQEPLSPLIVKFQSPDLDLNRVDISVDKSIVFQELSCYSGGNFGCSETRLISNRKLIEFPSTMGSSRNFKSSEGKLIRILSQSELKAFQKFLVSHNLRNFDGTYKSYGRCEPPKLLPAAYFYKILSGERGSVRLDDTTFSCLENRLPLDLQEILREWRSISPQEILRERRSTSPQKILRERRFISVPSLFITVPWKLFGEVNF
jgi:hypothetical protein